ncbi:hypothetical protein BXZ70DRAFT_1006876 [Cristinia sonorae]|uniref:Uncharacterized protein n=1 Tax=Cristinia sonorae TaxID=1940300 RepID=A0A8K0XRV8_9AGAR|nr:hypothetical protein BXZ70DRAFT_1006876 [Cristinia sonorae]
MSKLKVSSPNSETPITALIHEALDAQEPHTFPSHPHPHPPPPGPFPPPPEQRTDREPRREQENRVDEQPQTTPKAPPTTLPTTSESLSSQNNTKDARSTAPTSHHWIQSPVLARRADIESDTETVMPDKLDEGVPNEWTTRLRLLSRYVQAQDELQAVERDTQIYELAHSSLPQPVPLVSAELQKARTEKIQALHSAVKDFAQSGLWHLAAQDPSPRAGLQLDQKFEELKALMEVLSATTRGLYAQVSGEKFPAIPPPPSFPSSGSLSSMDIESGPDDDAPRGKKRRRISREESVSTNDEDDIERALLQDEESLQERVGGLEARLLETENLLHEWQWDLSQDLNDKLTKYVDKFRASSKKESEQFTSVVTRDREEIEKIKAELTSMNADVRELAEEVADHIRVSTSVKNENALLQVELGKTIEMIAVMAHSQKEQNTKAQEEIQALTAEVERLKAREVPPQPSSPAIMLTPEVLQQLGQLLQGSEVLPGLQQRIRDEIIQPTMAEHLTQVTKIMQEQQKETATNIISKVDKTSDMIAAIARWADSIKRDVDPGLLMSPSSTT